MADQKVGGVYLEIGADIERGEPRKTIEKIRRIAERSRDIKVPVGLESVSRSQLAAARAAAQEAADRVKAIEFPTEVTAPARATVAAARKAAQALADSTAAVRFKSTVDEPARASVAAARKAAQAAATRAIEFPSTVGKVPRRTVAEAEEAAEQVAKKNPVDIPARTDLDAAFVKRLQSQAKAAAKRAEAEIPFTADGEEMRRDLAAQIEHIEKTLSAEIPVEPEKAASWRANVQEMVDAIEREEAELPVVPDVDSTVASARMSWLTRAREVSIVPKLDTAALAKVSTQLLALSGLRAVTDRVQSLGRALMRLDQTVPSIAAVSTAITTLGAGALAGTSNLLALGSSLAQIAPAALALPGIFAGFGVGLGVMVAALVDAKDVLEDLGPAFSDLQDNISEAFWSQAEEPIRELANRTLPLLNDRLSEIGSELGIFFASFAGAAGSADNLSHLDSVLGNVRDSIDIAGEGIAHFTDAMMGLIDVGASYLPDLASWFNRVSEDFSSFIEEATNSGEIFDWIDAGIQGLQDLGRVLWNAGGILGDFARAAAEAGGASLGSLADALERVNTALDTPQWQGALTTVFQGAHDAMENLTPGVAALGDAFLSLAPTMAEVMRIAGDIGGTALAGISEAFQDPAFQGGLLDFFEGVRSAVEELRPHMPALAAGFGAVASFAGTLAETLGPVLGSAIEALSPVVTDLMEALSAIAPILGDVLVQAIEAVAPVIQDLVSTISEWVQENPELAATILAVTAGLGLFLASLLPLLASLGSFVLSVLSAVGGSSALAGIMTSLGGIISAALGPVLLIVAGVTALAAAFVYAWTTSEEFRNAVVGFGQAIMEFLQPVIDFLMGTVIPTVMQVAQAFIGMIQQILEALVPFWTVMLQIWTEIIAIMTPVVEFIMSILAPAFEHLGNVVSAIFTFIGVIISEVINVVTAIMQVFLAFLQGDWNGVWLAVQNVVTVVWQAIQNIVGAAITYLRTIIQSGLQFISSIWSAIWSVIGNTATAIWNGIRLVITSTITHIRNFITNVLNGIRNIWVTVWGTIRSFAATVWNAITSVINNGINRAKSFVTNGLNAIRTVFTNVWNAVRAVVARVLTAIVSVIRNGINNARNAVTNGLNAIRNTFTSIFNAVRARVASIFTSIVSTMRNGINNARNAVTNGLNAIKARFAAILTAIISGIRGRIGAVVGAFRSMMDRAKNVVNGFVGQFRSIGSRIIDGLAGGIRSAAGRAAEAARGAVSGALNKAKSALGIASPSREFYKVGGWSVDGFVNALEDGSRDAARAAERMVSVPAPAPLRLPAGAYSPIITAQRTTPIEPSAQERLAGAAPGISSSDMAALATLMAQEVSEAVARRPLQLNRRQLGNIYTEGRKSAAALGGTP